MSIVTGAQSCFLYFAVDVDFTIPANFLALNNEVRQACLDIETILDNIPEPTENVTLSITPLSPDLDTLVTTTTTIIISKQRDQFSFKSTLCYYNNINAMFLDSNECVEGTNDCFDDSLCTDTSTGFVCRCPEGYIDRDGDGKVCIGKRYNIENKKPQWCLMMYTDVLSFICCRYK